MILIVCATWQQFTLWCSEQHPQQNPNDRKFVVITASNHSPIGGTRGRHKQEGDRLIMLDRIPGQPFPSLREIAMSLIPCGFDEIEIDGVPSPLRSLL